VTDIANPVAELRVALAGIVGAEHVLTDPALMEQYVVDWSRRWRGDAALVVRPGSTDEVAGVLRACSARGVPVVTQGGNTGLVGGSVPAAGGDPLPVVLSTRRLDHLGDVDDLSGQVTVGAGATLGDVQRHAAAAGWHYGVDLAARDSATIGGTVATNAGGIHVVAFGMTRLQIVGIEAVLPDGSVLSHLAGMLKDNTGYDLGSLFCGSEGTLGVITAVRLRLHRPVGRTSVALIGASTYAEAIDLMSSAVDPSVRLIAAEVTDEQGMELAAQMNGVAWPLAQRHPLVVLLEVADGGDASGFMAGADRVDGHTWGLDDDADVVIGLDASEQARLWKFRESQGEAFTALGITHKLDVSVPLPSLAACAEELRAIVGAWPTMEKFGVFGHLADGNIHVEMFGPDADDLGIDLAILECVARYGGSVSAEHGVGRAKAGELHLCRSAEELAAMRAIKGAWDPQGLMNPGVVFG